MIDPNLTKIDNLLQHSIGPAARDIAYISITGDLILITNGEVIRYRLERI